MPQIPLALSALTLRAHDEERGVGRIAVTDFESPSARRQAGIQTLAPLAPYFEHFIQKLEASRASGAA